jgi:hypothetical protein
MVFAAQMPNERFAPRPRLIAKPQDPAESAIDEDDALKPADFGR